MCRFAEFQVLGVSLKSALISLFVILCVVVAACGGNAEPASTSIAVTEVSTATPDFDQGDGTAIGPDGGTVTSDDGGFTVEIPAGAIDESILVSIDVSAAADVGVDESLIAGPIYQLNPDGAVFDVPVLTVRRLSAANLGIANNVVPFFHVFQGIDDGWVPLSTETTRDGDSLVVVAETDHFSPNVVVETSKVFGTSTVKLELEPAAFTAPIGGHESTSFSWDLAEVRDSFGEERVLTFGGAVVAHEPSDDSPGANRAFCGDTAGEGVYGVEISGELEVEGDVEGIDEMLLILFGAVPYSFEQFTVAANGMATCTKPDASPIKAVAGVVSGPIDFKTHENSPPGASFTADFETDIDAVALAVKKTQKPDQVTEGPIDPSTLIYFTSAVNAGHFEAYVGGVCVLEEDSIYYGGYSFGGPPSMADNFQAFLDSIPGLKASVSSPQSISVDPSLVPGCDLFTSDPWAYANHMRNSFGPQGPIPDAQWDLLYSGELFDE